MQQDQVWRPMVFIFVFALAPGNGDAFNSFLLADPDSLPAQDDEWPGGIAPLNFSDSEFAYVATIAQMANVPPPTHRLNSSERVRFRMFVFREFAFSFPCFVG